MSLTNWLIRRCEREGIRKVVFPKAACYHFLEDSVARGYNDKSNYSPQGKITAGFSE